ncbi:MAG: cation-transporting P-type ATPase, partial [Planctomycetia bacterium]
MAAAETPWHAFDVADVARRLGSDPDRGLTAAEAGRRLAAHGPNALDEPPPDPLWRKVIGQFRELVIWILLVAAGIAAVLGDWADAAAIVAIVPGDRIEIEAGDQVPADARLVEAFGLHLQEAALTGESEPVEKAPGDALAAETPLGDRRTMVHAGTVVAAGRGAALVVATGMRTELGRIAGLLERSPPETTPLQRRLAELGRV